MILEDQELRAGTSLPLRKLVKAEVVSFLLLSVDCRLAPTFSFGRYSLKTVYSIAKDLKGTEMSSAISAVSNADCYSCARQSRFFRPRLHLDRYRHPYCALLIVQNPAHIRH